MLSDVINCSHSVSLVSKYPFTALNRTSVLEDGIGESHNIFNLPRGAAGGRCIILIEITAQIDNIFLVDLFDNLRVAGVIDYY